MLNIMGDMDLRQNLYVQLNEVFFYSRTKVIKECFDDSDFNRILILYHTTIKLYSCGYGNLLFSINCTKEAAPDPISFSYKQGSSSCPYTDIHVRGERCQCPWQKLLCFR